MHQIRLREPWSVATDEVSGAIIYTRKFHKPTGTEDQQTIALRVALLQEDLEGSETILSVRINGQELSPSVQSAETRPQTLHFPLTDLNEFNTLEVHISGTTGTTGPIRPNLDATAIPIFGSFVIKSVELQID